MRPRKRRPLPLSAWQTFLLDDAPDMYNIQNFETAVAVFFVKLPDGERANVSAFCYGLRDEEPRLSKGFYIGIEDFFNARRGERIGLDSDIWSLVGQPQRRRIKFGSTLLVASCVHLLPATGVAPEFKIQARLPLPARYVYERVEVDAKADPPRRPHRAASDVPPAAPAPTKRAVQAKMAPAPTKRQAVEPAYVVRFARAMS